jgi:hypothetical protein
MPSRPATGTTRMPCFCQTPRIFSATLPGLPESLVSAASAWRTMAVLASTTLMLCSVIVMVTKSDLPSIRSAMKLALVSTLPPEWP